MNTANLQLEGLLLAVSAIAEALKDKHLLSEAEIDAALGRAEAVAGSDPGRSDLVSPANVAAVLFPIRFLREANGSSGASFSRLAAQVARNAG
ncbi:hypothetical protein [Aquibium microcysteis]|uniref:hypothetical protein n=1 Tax=Aquibium microcysteis TaxID=675281 RepID=UPI00165D1EC9|nr:hypothetical protein [Aquibium microcysteis]